MREFGLSSNKKNKRGKTKIEQARDLQARLEALGFHVRPLIKTVWSSDGKVVIGRVMEQIFFCSSIQITMARRKAGLDDTAAEAVGEDAGQQLDAVEASTVVADLQEREGAHPFEGGGYRGAKRREEKKATTTATISARARARARIGGSTSSISINSVSGTSQKPSGLMSRRQGIGTRLTSRF
ncbi:MAG: hypothetical protein Q9187_000986 [Circinaria calcarea]